ncbi:MAG: pentapeptide repeat-containing protein [Microcoleus sp. SM1_3_4]|nr:pentapeptide repeat-containing protein [Microcoleus sp. SM1_3_4]
MNSTELLSADELLTRHRNGERDFRGANLMTAHLSEANLSRTNLSGANLKGANLIKSKIDRRSGAPDGHGESINTIPGGIPA